ncbi:FeoC-like transcriptional regulator [Vibrio sp. 10N.261.55.A7]|uniref:FeoC-like transcriptional regulator n=1 Tax=Vibrio TaxID=662 RepID=UPI000C859BC3|nr:FeoC-like transcriptional regulator [Vibrio sp. 10N.261.55.A7]PMK00823.1 iron transporter FeoC [Vibrio sp. 10N.261.55.A7]
MILSALFEYISEHGTLSRSKLASKFLMSEDGVDVMLNVWVKKGKISRMIDTNKHGEITQVRYKRNEFDSLSMTVTM